MPGIPYRFLPWVRRGLARSYAEPDDGQSNRSARPKVSVGLTLQASQDGTPAAAVSGNINLRLYGPGDVIGIDPRLVVRTDPRPNVTNFEPNYLAIVDFDPPDFVWMMTPAHASPSPDNHLRPWLVLVVVERRFGVPRLSPGRPLPSINLGVGQVKSELPDLSESWYWAHGQAVSLKTDLPGVETELKDAPERNISRLICPRRLQPNTNYVACVVPAFEVGRIRGLGQPVQEGDLTLTPAWDTQHPSDRELPVYYHWEFSTGPVGDIEALARRLKTPKQYKGDAPLLAQLDHIGELPVAVDADKVVDKGGSTVFEGALVSLDFKPAPADSGFASHLETILNSGQAQASTGKEKEAKVPTLSPPIYGEHPAKRHVVDRSKVSANWLDQLNLQPRYRLAAGWGAEVVRKYQDEFMQAAWEQVGDVLAAERALSMSRLSLDVLKVIENRHLAKLQAGRLLAVLGPMRARIKVAPEQSLYGRIGQATLPDELLGGAMRRLTSARRPTLRMAQWRQHKAEESIPLQVADLVKKFADATENRDAIDPNRFVPDGIMGSRSFEHIPLPANPEALVDLQPYTGYAATITGKEIRQIQDGVRLEKADAAKIKAGTPPPMENVRRDGLLTETHQLRLLELRRASSEPLDESELVAQLRKASRPGVDGVLLSVQEGGRVHAQALKIDADKGTLKTVGPVHASVGPATATPPAAGAVRGAIAEIPARALRLHGGDAFIRRLPVGAVGQPGLRARISVDRAGRFSPAAVAPTERPITNITVPPVIRAPEIIARYTTAFKDYQKLWQETELPAREAVVPVDFAVAQSTSDVQVRINPQRTVPARLASTLSLGDQAVTWDSTKGMVNAFVSRRLDLAVSERLRYVIPLAFDRVMAYPKLAFPLAKKLEILAPEVFLPGVGVLPDDFIMAVSTNPRFVEALMLGANMEMGRELLWQGFPTDQRGTPFQHFWRRLDGGIDIEPIHLWRPMQLGSQPSSKSMLVLLIRGQLLERFPNLSIYAYPKGDKDTRPGGTIQPHAGEMDPSLMELPVLRGHLGKDITYVGFDTKIPPTEDGMQHWFFVLEEQITEPRFGFDEPGSAADDGSSWQKVDWENVRVESGDYFGLTNLTKVAPGRTAAWKHPQAGHVAQALFQMPFRGYYEGVDLVTPKS